MDTTTCTDGSIKWYKWGRVVMVIMSITPDKSKMTDDWKSYRIATGCPKAVANGNGFAVSTDTLDRVNYIEPRTDDALSLHCPMWVALLKSTALLLTYPNHNSTKDGGYFYVSNSKF